MCTLCFQFFIHDKILLCMIEKRKMKCLEKQQFDEIKRRLKDVYQSQHQQRIDRYITYDGKKKRVCFKKDAPPEWMSVFHDLRRIVCGQHHNQRRRSPINVPPQLTRDIFHTADYRVYREVKKTALQWVITIYAYILSLRLHTPVRCELTLEKCRLVCVKRGFLDTANHSSHITLTLSSLTGDHIFQKQYSMDGAMAYDHDDYHVLSDLYHMFSFFPVYIDPFLHNQFQDLLVGIRHDNGVILLLTRYPLQWRRVVSTRPSPDLYNNRELFQGEDLPLSDFGREVFMPILTARDDTPQHRARSKMSILEFLNLFPMTTTFQELDGIMERYDD